jgi:DNA-binding NarL/FixJ family response regulator
MVRRIASRPGDSSQPAADLARKRVLVADLCKLLGGKKLAASRQSVIADIQPALSGRQRQTLDALLAGDSEKQIARKLAISPHTVHVHVKTIYKRLNVCSRGELLARFVERAGSAIP